MSWTSGAQSGWLTDNTSGDRTVSKIQGKATKHNGRNQISRLVHARDDKKKIVAWKLELDRILQVFNVCFIPYGRSPLSIAHSD